MVCLGRPYHIKIFKDCLPQILLSLYLNTLPHTKETWLLHFSIITFIERTKCKYRTVKILRRDSISNNNIIFVINHKFDSSIPLHSLYDVLYIDKYIKNEQKNAKTSSKHK